MEALLKHLTGGPCPSHTTCTCALHGIEGENLLVKIVSLEDIIPDSLYFGMRTIEHVERIAH